MLIGMRLVHSVVPLAFCLSVLSCRPLYDGGREDRRATKGATSIQDPADLIVLGESLVGVDGQALDAVVLRGGRIVAVTSRSGALRFKGVRTVVHEYPGARILPGLTDAHGHLLGLGKALEVADLRGATSYEELLRRLDRAAKLLPPGSWLEGRSWDQNLWADKRLPDHLLLSKRFPDRPVWLRRVDGHAGLANAKAMELAGISARTKDPKGGKIQRFQDRKPTGVFIDNAMGLISRLLPMADQRAVRRRFLLAQKHCLSKGLTRVHDAGISPSRARLLRRLEQEGLWKLGVYGMWSAPGSHGQPAQPDDPGPRALLRFRAIKLYADGALGSRGAALLAPYSDDPGNTGLLTTEPAELERLIRAAADRGLQPCVHAIGDRANRLVLDLYERVLSREQRASLRPRIEHAQVVAISDLPRFRQLGVIASMQPTHLTSDMPWAPARVGPQRVPGAYAFKTLLSMGTRLAFGSDFPVEKANPADGLFAAITTRPPSNPEAAPLRKDQRMSATDALAAFTTGAAYAAFEEGVRGKLAKGYEGDLTVLDRDPTRSRPEAILGVRVLATYVKGRLAFSANNEPEEERETNGR